jgi:hypothetical protein
MNTSRKFDQHSVLRESVLNEFTAEKIQQPQAAPPIKLSVDDSWLCVKRIQNKLLDEDFISKNVKSSMKRQLVVQGRLR